VESIAKMIAGVDATVARAALEQQKAAVQAKAAALDKKLQTQTVLLEQADVKTAAAAIVTAQQTLNGSPPHTLQGLVEATETIRTATRPVWGICGSNLWVDPNQSLWKDWSPYISPISAKLSQEAASVGLFYQYAKNADGSLSFYGTGAPGFVIGDTAILTNRHVLAQYAYQDGTGWHLYDGQILRIVFPYEYSHCQPRQNSREVTIVSIGPVGTAADDDYAVLLVAKGQLPPAVDLAPAFNIAEGARVAVLGYPGRPDSCNGVPATPDHPCSYLTSTQVDLLFQLPDHAVPFPIERFAPGMVIVNPLAKVNDFSYDSSTWGGSSGSPIVSLVDGSVVGLHYAGVGGDVANVGYNNAITVSRLRAALANTGLIK
jgi:hypothetical protein